ncbi:MAG TPA: polysaccharide ABC transporter ATP-binding protein [Pirellulales bacterium]|jgi:lipopolysaccharide transport system ATP-binding protein|nr:polysaccharide ABC transporter ATP-binding protein [Pirellulales bacterium]
MTRLAVRVEGLSKRYRIGSREPYHRFSELLSGWGRRVITAPRGWIERARGGGAADLNGHNQAPPNQAPPDQFWALKDVSFEIHEGEVLGIVGRNGAGKSTLLKILSRITEPTAGRFGLRGRVASLLEVGTGFHPELTGRDNIYLNGAVLGMTRQEIRGKFDEIVAFAETEPFLDTPVKHYSSGMYMRLAFAVAAFLEPEILLIDEVLAVGDAEFQKKCLGKMRQVARGGRTVLFVTHNMLAVQAFCDRALRFDAGRLRADSRPQEIIAAYCNGGLPVAAERFWDDPATAPRGGGVRLSSVVARATGQGDDGSPGSLTIDNSIDLAIELHNGVAGTKLNLSVHVLTEDGTTAFVTTTPPAIEPEGTIRFACRIPPHLLNDGAYAVTVLVVRDESVVVLESARVVTFQVDELRRSCNWFGRWPGVVRPRLDWSVSRSPNVSPLPVGEG